jgi:hypothetical protein
VHVGKYQRKDNSFCRRRQLDGPAVTTYFTGDVMIFILPWVVPPRWPLSIQWIGM